MSTDIKQSPEFWDAIADSLEKQAAEARTTALRLRAEQGIEHPFAQPRRSVNRREAAHQRLLGLGANKASDDALAWARHSADAEVRSWTI